MAVGRAVRVPTIAAPRRARRLTPGKNGNVDFEDPGGYAARVRAY